MAELREAIEAAMTAEEPKDDLPPETTVVEPAEAPVTEPVDSEAAPSAPAPTEPKSESDKATDKAETPAEAEARVAKSRVDRPPASWKGEAKGEWAAVPLHIRQEIHRRETQVNKTMEEAKTYRDISAAFEQAFTPHMQRIQSYGANPVQMVDTLLQTEATLASGSQFQKAEAIANLIRQYGIDIGSLDEVLSRTLNKQPQAPDITAELEQRLMQRFQPLIQKVQTFEQQQRQQEQAMQQEVQHTVESMALDPKYPYFDAVRDDMADIIEMASKRGQTISLEQAYQRAVRMNDDVYQTTTVQQQNTAAQKAKAAAVSVSSNPGFSGASVNQGDGSLRSAIEAAFGANRI